MADFLLACAKVTWCDSPPQPLPRCWPPELLPRRLPPPGRPSATTRTACQASPPARSSAHRAITPPTTCSRPRPGEGWSFAALRGGMRPDTSGHLRWQESRMRTATAWVTRTTSRKRRMGCSSPASPRTGKPSGYAGTHRSRSSLTRAVSSRSHPYRRLSIRRLPRPPRARNETSACPVPDRCYP
jgi:hypothetical protein